MLAKVRSAGVLGVDAYGVCAEVDVSHGLPAYHLVGLGAGAVKEGGVRIRAALQNAGWKLSARKVTINLAPADVRKDGAAFDLPIAVGILAAQEVVPHRSLEDTLLLGELSLDGTVRDVSGALPIAMYARQQGVKTLILPRETAREAAVLSGITILAANSLPEVASFLNGSAELVRASELPRLAPPTTEPIDLVDVRGQEHAKMALELAAAGAHNLLLAGAPGTGKSMLAQRLCSILPPLDEAEALETSAVYSAAGKLKGALIATRPFRAPHHDVSVAGLIGGGQIPRPGEISLAHHGVLFLDELPEFKRSALEALRQPLEERVVTIVRAKASVRFPANFALIAAMNPCPCGYHGSLVRACTCDVGRVRRYHARLSGPLLDRFDLQVYVPQVNWHELTAGRDGESSESVRARVLAARERQRKRLAGTGLHSNAQLGSRQLWRHCAIEGAALSLLEQVAERRGMSARAVHRVLRVARTAADLRGAEQVGREEVQVALAFRHFDQEAV